MDRAFRRIASFFLVLIAVFVFGAGQEYYNDHIKPRLDPPTPAPTVSPLRRPSPTARFVTDTPRPNGDCLHWSSITASHVNSTRCVYGTVRRIEDTYAWIVRFQPERSAFFFVSASVWYPDVVVGQCVLARGKILLSAENVPYLNITNSLYFCEPWME